MNEEYRELREQLRRQHAMNLDEVHGKGSYVHYPYTASEERKAMETPVGFRLAFKMKVLFFLVCIMLFSLYIYGGQNVKKGADLAWDEITQAVAKLEEEEPLVRETISYCKKGYHWMKEATKELD